MSAAKAPSQQAHKANGHKGAVPVIPYLPEEIDYFEKRTRQFLSDGADATQYRAFRLRQGVYGQRQPGVQMFRIKIPFGRLTPAQLEAIGRLAKDFTETGRGHLTTRENVQLHFLKLEDSAEAMRILGEVGLTSREACGNTIRNITGCPLQGVCASEPFDVTPYAAAFARFLVRHPVTQNMPRKFKPSFSGCESDCAITPMHDIGFVARTRDGRKGFKMVVGGGLSIMPRMAPTLYEFVPVEDFLRVSEAVVRVYNRQEDLRKNRMKARIKVLVDRIGMDAFRKMVEEELKGDWAKKTFDLDTLGAMDDEASDFPAALPVRTPVADPGNDAAFTEWKQSNVVPQKQPGYGVATIRIRMGNLTGDQFFGLAKIARDFVGEGPSLRITQRQNLAVRWVRNEHQYGLYQALKALDLAESGANGLVDVVSCPGTESCSLGITASTLMGAYLTDYVKGLKVTDPLVRAMRINISGCPDGCGQHHLGNLGFQGAAMRNESGQIPAYEVYVAGSLVPPIRVGYRLKTRVPSKRVPQAISTITERYVKERRDNEPFNDWVDRVGAEHVDQLLAPLADVPKINRQTIDLYIDYGRSVLYKVQRGEGECAI
ncbi:MAG: nitrite/sulfite reductase [Dehalococcoidia bacterium]|nr:nitrite/sulfite reductase [Dehalococcoidia bacterium]